MKKHVLLPLFLFAIHVGTFGQADCASSVSICGNTTNFNPSGVGITLEQLACGGIEHNSVWFTFQAKANGKLNFVIRPFTPAGLPTAVDVDWSLFRLAGAPGTTNCNNRTQLSCNFAGSATVFGIPGATGMASPQNAGTQFNPGINVVNGQWYSLMVDQFSNTTPILISVQFTGNTEFAGLNSSPGIFDNEPDFTVNTTNACNGNFGFTNTSTSAVGIASYLWNFGDNTTSTSPNPVKAYVAPGTYFVSLTITDLNGCQSTIRKTVVYNATSPTMASGGVFVTPACSDSNNGTLTVTTTGATTPGVTGGTPPYTYELISPSPMIRGAQSSNQFTGLQAGTYTIRTTDACGRSAVVTTVITQVATNSAIGLGIGNIESACIGTASGTATLFANGSAPPYTMGLVTSSPVTTGPLPAVQRDPVTATYFTTFTNLLPGLYTVEAVDGCGKQRRATFTVTASTLPLANSITSPSCAGSATGTIVVTTTAATGLSGTGAPGIAEYALIAPSPIIRPFQTGSVFENLRPGAYTVAVRDVCGNIGTFAATVNTATLPNFGTSLAQTSCPNGSTGVIEAQLGTNGGGGSPYTWELIAPSPVVRAPQASSIFGNLPPGVYSVRLSDACGSSNIASVTVPAAVAPSFTTATTASCTGVASGTITVTPGGSALAPFQFELISPGAAIRPIQASNIANTNNTQFTTLNAGGYTVRMTDACGVSVTGSATVSTPTALVFPTGSAAVPSCAAGSTGQLTIAQPTTGLGAYRYAIIAPSPVTRPAQTSRIFTGLPPGNYTIEITDSCGTQVNNAATPISLGAATAPTLTVTNTASCTTASGTITCLAANANQGGGTYQFALIAPSAVTRVNQSSPIFTSLPAGNYTVQITDQCGQTGTITTTVAAAGAFTPAAGGSVVSCSGSSYISQVIVTTPQNFTTGGPIPTGSGGGPYTFAVYDAANTTLIAGPQSSNVFSSIVPLPGAPSHTVRITDVCGNTSTTTVSLNPPAAVTAATISVIASSCAASATGTIRVTTPSSGGLPPYRYSLVNATTLAVVAGPQSSTIFTNVAADAAGYVVRTADACGNTITSSTPLLFPAAVPPTATAATVASCASPDAGRITVTPGTGATFAAGTFTYALYDAANTTLVRATQASPVFNNVATGTYTVRIIDRCGTEGTVSATIASGAPTPVVTGTATGTCVGGSSGSVRGSCTGTTLPVTFSLINQVTSAVVAGPQTDSVFTGLPNGTYLVRVTDPCGTVVNSANIVLGDLSTAPTISSTSAIDCAGLAIIGAYGGGGSGGPYSYALCSGAGCTTFGSFNNSSTFTVVSSGTYRVATRDRCGNQTSTADINITIPSKPIITGVTKANACGTTTITPAFTGVPNTPFYSINGANFGTSLPSVSTGCNNIRVADNNAGTFGCASDAFDISVFAPPTINTPTTGQVNCFTGGVSASINTTGGNLGCAGSGASYGVKLVSCVGCTGAADPIGTIRASGGTFNLIGASSASFAGTVQLGGSEVCAGTPLNVDFAANYCFGGALPIRMEYLRGQRLGNQHALNWKVSCTNTQTVNLALERSANGRDFNAIYSLQTNANRCQQPFDYIDATPLGGLNYYRVKMIDDQGVVTYSQIVSLLNKPTGFQIIGIAPNPVTKSGNAILQVSSAQVEPMLVQVFDLTGRQLIQQTQVLIAGDNPVALRLSKLSAGVFQIKVSTKTGGSQTVRFVKE